MKFQKEDSPIGDLARDAIYDLEWDAKGNNFFTYLSYIECRGACQGAIDALISVFSLYEGIDYKRVFSNVDCYDPNTDNWTMVSLKSGDRLKCVRGMVYIYGLISNSEVHYIGKTKNPSRRLRGHIFHPHNVRLSEWVNGLLERGHYPLMGIVDVVAEGVSTAYERAYIRGFEYANGFSLLNTQLCSALIDKDASVRGVV